MDAVEAFYGKRHLHCVFTVGLLEEKREPQLKLWFCWLITFIELTATGDI